MNIKKIMLMAAMMPAIAFAGENKNVNVNAADAANISNDTTFTVNNRPCCQNYLATDCCRRRRLDSGFADCACAC